jgi:hypothetical protein
MERGIDPVPPAREPVEQPNPKPSAKPEIALVAAEAAEPCCRQQQQGIDQTLRRREPGKQDHGLAFEGQMNAMT